MRLNSLVKNGCSQMRKSSSLIYQNHRQFSNAVYLWTSMPRLGPKATELKQQFAIPKGVPKRIESFDNLDVTKICIGLRHSAVITSKRMGLRT